VANGEAKMNIDMLKQQLRWTYTLSWMSCMQYSRTFNNNVRCHTLPYWVCGLDLYPVWVPKGIM
jgi:hypothetical protein